MKILQNTVGTDIAGVGLVASNNQIKSGGVRDMQLFSTAAYHVSLGENDNHYLAAGFQAGFVQKSFNPQKMLFPNQWSPSTGKSANIPSGESFATTSISYFDMNAGLLWYTFLGKGSHLFLGGATFHPHQPDASFSSEATPLSARYLVHGGGKISTGPKFSIAPNLLAMFQGPHQEVNLGSSFEFAFPDINGLFTIGGWYRFNDAVIAATSFKYDNYKLGISYDITVSDLQTANQNQGGFEISLIIGIPGATDVEVETHPGPKI
jgi:type IX secretion system PorP/SprF family membrane protein